MELFREEHQVVTHVRILAWFNIVLGGIGVLMALAVFAGASILPAIIVNLTHDVDIPIALIQLIATVVIAVILLMSLPCLVLGFGLYNFRPWARVLGIVLAAINLLHVPFGTIVSLYGFWVLLKPETEALFAAPQPAQF